MTKTATLRDPSLADGVPVLGEVDERIAVETLADELEATCDCGMRPQRAAERRRHQIKSTRPPHLMRLAGTVAPRSLVGPRCGSKVSRSCRRRGV